MKKFNVLLTIIFCLALVVSANAQTSWEKYNDNPVLPPGSPGSWDEEAFPGCVLFDNSMYKLWYSGWNGSGCRIGYATSPDGIDWTKYEGNPVIELGQQGEFDEISAEAPHVLYHEGIYKMWYNGYGGNPSANRIGYATSSDGINWDKHPSNPVMDCGPESWDNAGVWGPSVLIDEEIYKIWYAGYNGATIRIGHAVSDDGIEWTKYESNPVLESGPYGSWDDANVNDPMVLKNGPVYQLWYMGHDGTRGRIGYATSTDGLAWVKSESTNPVLEHGAYGSWDDGGVRDPWIYNDNGIYKMWYVGIYHDGVYGTGYAIDPVTIINIPDDYPTIQQGINVSVDCDTVLVQPGTYIENINFNGHNIVLGSLFLTTQDTSYISQTIIDGDSSSSVVKFEYGEDSTTVITGFTIQNGFAHNGGGIYCANFSNPAINNNIIKGNFIGDTTNVFGAGIYCEHANPSICYNVIKENSSVVFLTEVYSCYGGGVSCNQSDPEIFGNTIFSNSSFAAFNGYGGGIACNNYSNPLIENNLIFENGAGAFEGDAIGGGISCTGNSNPLICNNIIIANISSTGMEPYGLGGGIGCYLSNPFITNNTISENLASFAGGGIYCWASIPEITNTIFWGDSAYFNNEIWHDTSSDLYISYCDIEDTIIWVGEGNISINPLFVDPDNGDFHLQSIGGSYHDGQWLPDLAHSPCIDAGNPLFSYENEPLPNGNRINIGAYGNTDEASLSIDTTGINNKENNLPIHADLGHNYPNPFNASTVIRYDLPCQSQITINIYDILGRKVTTLVDKQQPAGYHQVIWRADDFSSGMYFYKLQAGNYNETKKMNLIK